MQVCLLMCIYVCVCMYVYMCVVCTCVFACVYVMRKDVFACVCDVGRYVCMCDMCMHVCMYGGCVLVCLHAYEHIWRSGVDVRSLPLITFHFIHLGKVSQLNTELTNTPIPAS